jgi:WD40 repeat protein
VTTATPAAPAPAAPGNFGSIEAPADAAPAPRAHELKAALPAATHGRAISGIAISDDGTAALTIDSGNSVRLWPSLDGTREPVAVPLVAATDIVLARDGSDFAIAALDAAGGVVILRVDTNGQLVGKASLPFDQPYKLLVAAGDGFLAIKSDQTIERIDYKGTHLGEVAPETGQRIATLVARRGRAIAMLTSPDGVIARWLETSSKTLAWGPATAPLAIDAQQVALSPDFTRLAVIQKKGRKASILELATGAITPLKGNRNDLVPLDWVSADRVAFAHDEFELSRVEWFDPTGKLIAAIGDDFELEFVSVLSMEAADDRVVSFMGHQVVLVEPKKLRYLGYQLHAASRLRATPAGMVASMGGKSEILDDSLQIERRGPTANARDLVPIDDTFALAISGIPTKTGAFDDSIEKPKPRKSGVEVVLFEGQTRQQVLKMKVSEMRLRYEPASHLLATNGGTSITFAKFDDVSKRFGDPVTLPVGSKIRDIFLLDPKTTNGAIALVVHGAAKGDLVTRPIFEAELTGAPAHESIALPGQLEDVDRAGHTYVRTDAKTIAIFDGTTELGKLVDLDKMKVRPAPDGKRVAIFGRGRVILTKLDGSEIWSIGFPAIKDLQWTDNDLVALANGIAKLDPATGQTVAARCGWKFGLRTQASFMDLAGSTICD